MLCVIAWTHSAAQRLPDVEAQVRALYERGEWAEAARLAAQTSSRSADLDFFRGLALARMDRLNDAEAAFLNGRRAHPRDSRFEFELAGVAYRRQQIGAAKRRLRAGLRWDPKNTYGNDFLATLYLLDGNLPAALKYWNRIDKPLVQEMQWEPALRMDPILRERTFAISPGQVLTLDRLRTTEDGLDRLDILASHQFDLALRSDQRFDLTFRSLEGGQLAGGWLSHLLPFLRGLPYQAVHADWYNLGRHAINVSSLMRWDPDKRRIRVGLEGPVRLNPRVKFRLAADARDELWELRDPNSGESFEGREFVQRKIEGGAELVYGVTNRLQWTTGLWTALRGYRNTAQDRIFSDGWSFEVRNGLQYRLWNLPERRVRSDASAMLRAGRVLNGTRSRFAMLEGNLHTVWLPQARGDDLIVEVRAAAGRTSGSVLFDQFFILGMERDNDLWLRGHVGTREGRKGSAPIGTQYALLQTGFLRTVLKLPFASVGAGPFLDAGRIGDPLRKFGSNGWMVDAGVEAQVRVIGRWNFKFVYGRNLRDGGGVFYTAVAPR